MPDNSDNTTIPFKTCPKCKSQYPQTAEYFHRSKTTKSGFTSRCKPCANDDHHDYYRKNKEQLLEKSRQYNAAHSAEHVKRVRQWKLANPEKSKTNNKKWTDAHKDQIKKVRTIWRKKNPEKQRAYARRWRRKKLDAAGSHTPEDIVAIYQSQKGLCYYCGVEVGEKYEVDHVDPISQGGSDSAWNLVIACPSCNRSKGDKSFVEWMFGAED